MSWIFSILLVGYGLVRLILWSRGQLRWWAVRQDLPSPPPELPTPRHLSAGLGQLFVSCHHLRVELAHALRRISVALLKDPDAALGQIRDRSYRRALMESFSHLNAWLRFVEALPEAERLALADLGTSGLGDQHLARISSRVSSLRPHWKAVAAARALDPFELAQVEDARRTLAQIDEDIQALERDLSSVAADPYRDRVRAAAPHGPASASLI